MIELENPQIESVEEAGTYAKYEAGPLQAGYGVTLGNALRRVLLSSLEGADLVLGVRADFLDGLDLGRLEFDHQGGYLE